jgi:hypothetical protein
MQSIDRLQPINPSQSIQTIAIAITWIIVLDAIQSICLIAIDHLIAINLIHRNQSIDCNWPIATNQSISIDSNYRNHSNHCITFDPIDSPNCYRLYNRHQFDQSQSINQSIVTDRLQSTNPSHLIWTIAITRIILIDSIQLIRLIAIDRYITIEQVTFKQSIAIDRSIAIDQSIAIDW